ncbi:Uncharacterised protein [Legionella steigerwaltii]|uniref:Uncharacterized protein n=1 Tax=Legionella steigerwaltii TaxID=460 RepID=A0A378L9R7_9GAMM|nr:hypothetical protein [Legionella steigerwaltii]KTD71525.1 hypothetical protein Lstg_2934 [Legionella steigerwaltii]STY23553.1 Uncharacterised protein [Legionella steigerwaltii]
MKNSELLQIAREACAYARKHIIESETTPQIQFYEENADLFADMAEQRKEQLKKKYAEQYKNRLAAGRQESDIFAFLEVLDRGILQDKIADMRKHADKLWEAFCTKKDIDINSELSDSIRNHALEYFVTKIGIGNCGEFSRLAFIYIQQKYPEQLEQMNLTVLGVNRGRHLVVSLGDDDNRVICDPTLDLVFELNEEPQKLHDFSQSQGNTYSPYNPEFHELSKLEIHHPEGLLDPKVIEELYQFGDETDEFKVFLSTRARKIEEKPNEHQTFEDICKNAIKTEYKEPGDSASIDDKLKYALQSYIKKRAEEAQVVSKSGVSYDEKNTRLDNIHALAIFKHALMWMKSGYSAGDKICTAQKVIDILNGERTELITEDELKILKDGRLGADTKTYLDRLENMCETQENLKVKKD